MIRVTIRECRDNGSQWTSQHRSESDEEAFAKALRKHWGTRASFFLNHGLSRQIEGGCYGQVMRWLDTSQYSSITGRVRIDFEKC
jgi:hypothetical protein